MEFLGALGSRILFEIPPKFLNLALNFPFMRTPQNTSAGNSIQKQAENLIALENAQTPLKGGLNTPMHEITEEDKAPMRTPNIVFGKTPTRPGAEDEVNPATDGSKTPARDAMGINNESSMANFGFDDDEEDEEFLGGEAGDLENQLEGLPEPKNDFEIVAPEEEEEAEAIGMTDDGPAAKKSKKDDSFENDIQIEDDVDDEDLAFGVVKVDDETKKLRAKEDMEDTIEKERQRKEKAKQDKLNKRHLPVKRNLPRPSVINEAILKPIETVDSLDQLAYADELIKVVWRGLFLNFFHAKEKLRHTHT